MPNDLRITGEKCVCLCLRFRRKMSSTYIASKMKMVCVLRARKRESLGENGMKIMNSDVNRYWYLIELKFGNSNIIHLELKMGEKCVSRLYQINIAITVSHKSGEQTGCSNSKLIGWWAIWFCINEMCITQSSGAATQTFPNNSRMFYFCFAEKKNICYQWQIKNNRFF